MKAVKFYIMPDEAVSGSAKMLDAVCHIITRHYYNNERVFVLSETKSQAEALDERLWQFDAEVFVAHNLVGEGPRSGAPVEIGWQRGHNRRQILVHLNAQIAPNLELYQHIVDFVPADEAGKQQARERYKAYRRLGLMPQTESLDI